jgi:ATP-dependent Clp protease ATP-binding subunit ClpA
VKGQVKKINSRIQKQNKITVSVGDDCLDYFFKLAAAPAVLEMGGRGIGNLMEEKYINPLAEFIFEANCTENSVVSTRIENDTLTFVKEG